MGWKAECIFINERDDGYLGTFPEHRPRLALDIIETLHLPYDVAGPLTSLDEGIYPRTLVIGGYDGAAIIGMPSIDEYMEPQTKAARRLLQAFPRAKILCIQLHSVVNMFGYSYYENGQFKRLRSGAAGSGLLADEGEPLPDEIPLFQQSTIRNGERFFYDPETEQEYDEAAFGEEFVFTLAKRYLGAPVDYFEAENLVMQRFTRSSWWSRWFKRGPHTTAV